MAGVTRPTLTPKEGVGGLQRSKHYLFCYVNRFPAGIRLIDYGDCFGISERMSRSTPDAWKYENIL